MRVSVGVDVGVVRGSHVGGECGAKLGDTRLRCILRRVGLCCRLGDAIDDDWSGGVGGRGLREIEERPIIYPMSEEGVSRTDRRVDELGDARRELHTAEVLHAYLDRIGYAGPTEPTFEVLAAIQLAHLVAVPFENLDVVAQVPVSTDTDTVVAKVLGGRGGWCFENNGACAWLLEQLGFRVRRLGAAVLRSGPAVEIDHLALEVQLDRPYLVDVGFGDSFLRPLRLDTAGPQRDDRGEWELLSSPQGTTLAEVIDGIPVAQYRFKRVEHHMADFEAASLKLQADAEGTFRTNPLATRLLGNGADRVTLFRDRLTLRSGAEIREVPVAAADWDAVLAEWFGIRR